MDIALISPIIDRNRRLLYHNLGIGYVGGALLQAGHNVTLLDLEVYKTERPSDNQLRKIIVSFFEHNDVQVAGIGGFLPSFPHIRWVVDIVREVRPEIKIWVGGSVASSIPEHILQIIDADVAVIDEGEVTVCELARKIDDGTPEDLDDVAGIVFRREGQTIRTQDRGVVEDIDSLPYPAWDLFDIERYISSPAWGGVRTMALTSTRGCPHRCYFCYHPFAGKRTRFHSPQRMLDEMEYATNKYNLDHIDFADDLTFAKPKRIMKFCDLYQQRGMKVKWGGSCRANLMTDELCKRIAECNCATIAVGIESFSTTILKNIKKGVTPAQNENIIRLLRKHNVTPALAFMLGNIGETRETAYESFQYIKRLKLKPRTFTYPTPFPQTELWRICQERGLIGDPITFYEKYDNLHTLMVNVSEMSDQELMDLREKLERKWRRHYYGFFRFHFGIIYSVISYFRSYGLLNTIKKIMLRSTRGRSVSEAV